MTKAGVLPNTCKGLSKVPCEGILGCTWGDQCEEDTDLSRDKCGSKSMKECIEDLECNYSILGQCFDNEKSGKVSDLPTTCAEITAKVFADPEKECNKAIGCEYDGSGKKCEENTALTANPPCGGKGELGCRKGPKCTWGDIVQKCFDEASVVMPTLSSCADIKNESKCNSIFGCAWEGTCGDDPATTLNAPCNALVELACKRSPVCGWSELRGGVCLTNPVVVVAGTTCPDLAKATCEADPGCAWNALCADNAVAVAAPCDAYIGHAVTVDRAACNANIECQWSGARGACYEKKSERSRLSCAALPIQTADGIGIGLCTATPGCEEQLDNCIDDFAFVPPDGSVCDGLDKDTCLAHPLCYHSPVRGCLSQVTAVTACVHFATGDECNSVFGCRWNEQAPARAVPGVAGACEDLLMPSSGVCNANHPQNGANDCWDAGCVYSNIALRTAAVVGGGGGGGDALAVYGGCFDPPAGIPKAGFCYGADGGKLNEFCHTKDGVGNKVACEALAIGAVDKVCQWKNQADNGAGGDPGGGNDQCNALRNDFITRMMTGCKG